MLALSISATETIFVFVKLSTCQGLSLTFQTLHRPLVPYKSISNNMNRKEFCKYETLWKLTEVFFYHFGTDLSKFSDEEGHTSCC